MDSTQRNDLKLIASPDSPFDPWIRAAVAAARAEIERLEAAEAAIRALHERSNDVHIDTIHKGFTPVYGDGCTECGVAWPCDTIAAFGA